MSAAPCPKGESRKGKHAWTFEQNVTTSRMTSGPRGVNVTLSSRGLYQCECGATRIGQSKSDQPGADLREVLGAMK